MQRFEQTWKGFTLPNLVKFGPAISEKSFKSWSMHADARMDAQKPQHAYSSAGISQLS